MRCMEINPTSKIFTGACVLHLSLKVSCEKEQDSSKSLETQSRKLMQCCFVCLISKIVTHDYVLVHIHLLFS